MILEPHSLWIAQTNSWIVSVNERECVIIDIPPDPLVIFKRIQVLNLRPVAIIATHGHIDHVGGISSFIDETDTPQLPVHLHPSDRHMIDDPLGNSATLASYLKEAGVRTSPPEIIIDLDHGQRVKGAGLDFEVIHTPGHTQGSVCLLVHDTPQGDLLFSGDHLFRDSIGRTDLPGGSYESLMESMVSRILPLADEVGVLPGHGPTTTIGRERKANPFLQIR